MNYNYARAWATTKWVIYGKDWQLIFHLKRFNGVLHISDPTQKWLKTIRGMRFQVIGDRLCTMLQTEAIISEFMIFERFTIPLNKIDWALLIELWSDPQY